MLPLALSLAGALAALIFLWFWLFPYLRRRGDGRLLIGGIKLLTGIPARLLWRVQYENFQIVPPTPGERGLIIVSNHTSGLDPILIEHGVDFNINWLMWRSMIFFPLKAFWRWKGTIPIDFSSRDRSAIRQAMRCIGDGQAIGIFPEGGIERPAKHIRPFMQGVGLVVARTKAPVLLLHVSGIPERKTAFGSLFRPCRARIKALEIIDYAGKRDVGWIAEDLRERIQVASGWPLADEPLVQPEDREQPEANS